MRIMTLMSMIVAILAGIELGAKAQITPQHSNYSVPKGGGSVYRYSNSRRQPC
jgi:hypothetical protein